jgi:hypothetical protein
MWLKNCGQIDRWTDIGRQRDRQKGDIINLLLFFQNKENVIKGSLLLSYSGLHIGEASRAIWPRRLAYRAQKYNLKYK